MKTDAVDSRLLYPRHGMVVMSADTYTCATVEMGQITKKPAVEWITL